MIVARSTLKEDGTQLSNLFIRRLIICTSRKAGDLVLPLYQHVMPKRGCRQKNKNKSEESKKANLKSILDFSTVWTLISFLLLGSFMTIPFKTYAAASELATSNQANTGATSLNETWQDMSFAKNTLKEIKPIVSEANTKDSLGLISAINLDINLDKKETVTEEKQTELVLKEDFVKKPFITETKVTVDPPKVVKTRIVLASTSSRTLTSAVLPKVDNGSRDFPYGNCTYYVAQKRQIPWTGNAGTWLNGAKSYGYETGSSPKPGAIVVTSEGSSKVGHVAYVESVDGDNITVSEMNYNGFGKISTRTISANYKLIKGFIY